MVMGSPTAARHAGGGVGGSKHLAAHAWTYKYPGRRLVLAAAGVVLLLSMLAVHRRHGTRGGDGYYDDDDEDVHYNLQDDGGAVDDDYGYDDSPGESSSYGAGGDGGGGGGGGSGAGNGPQSGAGGAYSWAAQAQPEQPPECPLWHDKPSLADVRGGVKPYLLGGAARPKCVTCARDGLWPNFCQYKSHGPVCYEYLQDGLLRDMLKHGEAWEGLLTLTPCELWEHLRGRTLFLLGDSQALNLYKAMKCFMYEFWDADAEEAPLVPGDEAANMAMTDPEGRTVRPQCVHMPGRTRLCFVRTVKWSFANEALLPALPAVAAPHDVALLNVGLWHHDRAEYAAGLRAFQSLYAAHKNCLPHMFWLTSSMQHFSTTRDGSYDNITTPFECAAIRNVTFDPDTHALRSDDPVQADVLAGGWRNEMASAAMREAGLPIVDTWNNTFEMHRYHKIPGQSEECTHFCHPSAQQVWVWEVYEALAARAPELRASLDEASRGAAQHWAERLGCPELARAAGHDLSRVRKRLTARVRLQSARAAVREKVAALRRRKQQRLELQRQNSHRDGGGDVGDSSA